jgi:hypothetical protein
MGYRYPTDEVERASKAEAIIYKHLQAACRELLEQRVVESLPATFVRTRIKDGKLRTTLGLTTDHATHEKNVDRMVRSRL